MVNEGSARGVRTPWREIRGLCSPPSASLTDHHHFIARIGSPHSMLDRSTVILRSHGHAGVLVGLGMRTYAQGWCLRPFLGDQEHGISTALSAPFR